LWDKKESNLFSGLQPTEEMENMRRTLATNQKTVAESHEERKGTSSWFTPGWPCWELFEEHFTEVGNPIQVIGTHINDLYQENYRDDPDICFYETDGMLANSISSARIVSCFALRWSRRVPAFTSLHLLK
jgi:hypothetical protein